MADKITIDMGDAPAKPTAFEALEKIGRFVVKMQEQDAKMQRIAQMPSTVPLLNTKQTLSSQKVILRKLRSTSRRVWRYCSLSTKILQISTQWLS